MVIGSKTIYVELAPAVIEHILKTILEFSEEHESVLLRIESKLKNDFGTSEGETKYRVIMARAQYQLRTVQPSLCASIYNAIYNLYERWKEDHELIRKPYLRIGLTIPRWQIISSIYSIKAMLIRPPNANLKDLHDPELNLLSQSEKITIEISNRFERLIKYEIENRGFKPMTHAV